MYIGRRHLAYIQHDTVLYLNYIFHSIDLPEISSQRLIHRQETRESYVHTGGHDKMGVDTNRKLTILNQS